MFIVFLIRRFRVRLGRTKALIRYAGWRSAQLLLQTKHSSCTHFWISRVVQSGLHCFDISTRVASIVRCSTVHNSYLTLIAPHTCIKEFWSANYRSRSCRPRFLELYAVTRASKILVFSDRLPWHRYLWFKLCSSNVQVTFKRNLRWVTIVREPDFSDCPLSVGCLRYSTEQVRFLVKTSVIRTLCTHVSVSPGEGHTG